MLRNRFLTLLALLCAACGSDSNGGTPDPGPRDGACEASELVGSFEASLANGFTSVQGKVEDGVSPQRVPQLVDTSGPCRLLRPPSLFCDPSCASGTTCDATGTCVPTPAGVSVGTVSVEGLKSPVEMTASPPVYFYTNTDPLEHPGFDESAELVLIASGDGDVGPFALGGRGVATLVVSATSVELDEGVPVEVSWMAPGDADAGVVHLELNIAQHGGTPGWIECEAPDTGSFELPVALSDQLLASGYSGFPSLEVTRRSADSASTEVGCVQFLVQSAARLDVEIPGLISCSITEDCPEGQTCQADLTCG